MKNVWRRNAASAAGWALGVLLLGTPGLFAPALAGATEDSPAAAAAAEPVADGPFKPDWDSLKKYQCPDWYRDAKFGIWAHWSAQCVPEQGDWYARNMYQQYRTGRGGKSAPNPVYVYHCEHYGHPSKVGFKDIDRLWHAEHWEPEKLMALYKRAGAKYFVALANHHDNFDCYDSKYQPWNSVRIGPKKDIVGVWKKAAGDAGLRFGVTVHAARAWGWFEVAQGADKDGEFAGVPYDGKLTKADGKGTWWEGLDPQDLYAQNHARGQKPDAAYCTRFYNRTIDLINKYRPDLLYFDDDYTDTGLPLYDTDPAVGLRIAAHFYNVNRRQHGGKLEAVLNAKRVSEDKRGSVVLDIERGGARDLQARPWQTDTCIGVWHYDRALAERHGYKKSGDVLRTLADVVSKNGNLLLSIPVRGDGTIDTDEVKCLEEMAAWMGVNGEAIFETRPWSVYGEGPSTTGGGKPAGPFGEGRTRYTAEDWRFTTKGKVLYAIGMAWPENGGKVTIKSLASDSPRVKGEIGAVRLLGQDAALTATRDANGLTVTLPPAKPASPNAPYALEIALAGEKAKSPSAGNGPKGRRVFYASHSLMWYVPTPLGEMTEAAGIKGHKLAGLQMLGASRTLQHWNLPDERNKAKDALKKGEVDVLVMSPIQYPDEGIDNYVKLGLEHNPDMRFVVQISWGGWDIDNQDFPKGATNNVNREKTPEQLKKLYERNIKAAEEQADVINKRAGKTVLYLVPSAQALVTLRTRISNKEMPGLTSQAELFRDPISHPAPPLEALNTYLHYAVIYGKSPVGLPAPGVLKNARKESWDDKFNRSLQEIAWETVSKYPYSGVKAEEKGEK